MQIASLSSRYTLWIVTPPDTIWSRVFDEVAIGLKSAFAALGQDVAIVDDPKDIRGTAIVLGAHLAKPHGLALPNDAIIYNLEQVHPASERFAPEYGYVEALKTHAVWDYSATNILALKEMGINDVIHCPIGYAPELTRIHPAKEDIDVMFVGGGHPRRNQVFEEIATRGMRFHAVFKLFGRERDEWLARGKIHLNVHKEPAGLFEIVRVSYLLANRRFVISETGADADMEAQFKDGVVFCEYNKLVNRCLHYLVEPKERKRIAEAGFELFRAMPQKLFLEKALDESAQQQPRPLKSVPTAQVAARSERVGGNIPPSIFIAIASYRDPECAPTLRDMFAKAAHPERLNIGLCLQYDPQSEPKCDVNIPEYSTQIHIERCHWSESNGANWARTRALSFLTDQEYVLLIDSHMRFEPGWDETLIDLLARCPSDNPVLSTYCPNYEPPNDLSVEPGYVLRMRVRTVTKLETMYLVSLAGVHVDVRTQDERLGLYPSPFCIANCIFTRAETFKKVPLDPYIHFWGDEMHYSARLWTHGYDIFQFDRAVLYHYWIRKDLMELHDYRVHGSEANVRSLKRINHLLGLVSSQDPLVTAQMEHYGLGSARQLADLWKFAGINWEQKLVALRSQEGYWDMYARKDGLTEKINNAPLPSIFVAIASYRDADCKNTVDDLFAKAKHPGRISVGICWQFIPGTDEHFFAHSSPHLSQVRVTHVNVAESKGAGWAHRQAQQLWQDEAFVLHIESSTRFEPGWDEALITMWKACDDNNAVLTTLPPQFTPPDQFKRHWIFGITPEGFTQDGILHTIAAPAYEVGLPYPNAPIAGMFASSRLLFGPARMIKDVPYDPYIDSVGEDVVLAVRLWTHGYNLFYPHQLVAFHYADDRRLQDYRADHSDWQIRRSLSLSRIRHVLQIEPSEETDATKELGLYGLGTTRTLEAYQQVSGVQFAKKKINAPETAAPRSAPPLETTRITAKRPKIFVNIASYRDPECQWTVKDLYEKARYPDRIYVGICWQFDEKEDQHCFEIVTRPEQVRIYPVDWREAEGVCWARHQTQLLWDGEEYTFMTDSHMRFVPGWDELMIEELARCPSAKPVLSSSPASYEPPNKLGTMMYPTFRRVRPFMPSGNIRCQAEAFDRYPPHPLNGAFVVCNNIFSRSEITPEVPYDPYLYFDQEEITYSARLYTHGWDVFCASKQFLYHYYNKDGESVRPLHWTDMRKEYAPEIRFLFDRGLKRFNHLTGHTPSDDQAIIIDVEKYGWGSARTLEQYEQYCGIDFKKKIAYDKALYGLFIKDIHLYRDRPVIVPELDGKKPETMPVKSTPLQTENPVTSVNEIQSTAPTSADAPAPLIIGRIPRQKFPVMLEPGDFAPLFYTFDTNRQHRGIEVYAGKYCLLTFLPATNSGALGTFFKELAARMTNFMVQTVWQIFVINDTLDNIIAFRNREQIQPLLWADPEGKIARAFGVKPDGGTVQPTGYVLSPKLQILHRHTGKGPSALAEGLVNDCAAEQQKFRDRNPDPKLITDARLAPAVIIDNVFSPEFCRRCIEEFKNGYTFEGTVGSKVGNEYKPDTKIRTDYIATGAILEELDYKLSRSFFPELERIFGFRITHRELYKIGLYTGEKQGFFKAHRDNFDPALGYRRIASTIHLNDEYEGGGVRFPEYDDFIYRPPAGAGIAFSCQTQHEARPVTKGERYVVVAFMHGDEDEGYRRHYCMSEKSPIRAEGYTATLRHYPDIELARGFFHKWRDENVAIDWISNDTTSQELPTGAIRLHENHLAQSTLVRTVGEHYCKKVFESRFGVVLDDFLPDDLFRRLQVIGNTTTYAEPSDTGKVSGGWHIHSGFPLRANTHYDYHSNVLNNKPTNTDLDRFYEYVLAVLPHVEKIIGRMDIDWDRFSVAPWVYPHGTALSVESGKNQMHTGSYVFGLNSAWYMEWGGLLALDEGESGLTKSIILRKNRMVFIAGNAYRMITRVDEKCGDEQRRVIAGNFHRKKAMKE